MEKLSVKGLALGLGIIGAVYVLFLGIISMFGWGIELVELLSSLYIGFEPTFPGSIIGAVWGFIDGAIAGAVIALVYNALVGKKDISQQPKKIP